MVHRLERSLLLNDVFASNLIAITYLKNKISVHGKARNGEKAEHTRSM